MKNQRGFGGILIILLILVFFILVGGLIYFNKAQVYDFLSSKLSNTKNVPSESITPATSSQQEGDTEAMPEIQSSSLENTLVYAVIENNQLIFYESDINAKPKVLYSKTLPNNKLSGQMIYASLSSDKTKLAYLLETDKDKIIIYNLKDKSEKEFKIQLSKGANYWTSFSWLPGKDYLLYINTERIQDESGKGELNEFISFLHLLDPSSGVDQPLPHNIPGYLGFTFKTSSLDKKLYFITSNQCAPGPCYDSIYSIDDKYQLSKEFNVVGTEFEHKGLGIDVISKNIIVSKSGMDMFSEAPYVGVIERYNLKSKSLEKILEKPNVVLTSAEGISPNEILYLQLPINVKPFDNNTINRKWYIYNTNTNQNKEVYSGNHLDNIIPINKEYGYFIRYGQDEMNELKIINFSNSSVIPLLKTKSQINIVNN